MQAKQWKGWWIELGPMCVGFCSTVAARCHWKPVASTHVLHTFYALIFPFLIVVLFRVFFLPPQNSLTKALILKAHHSDFRSYPPSLLFGLTQLSAPWHTSKRSEQRRCCLHKGGLESIARIYMLLFRLFRLKTISTLLIRAVSPSAEQEQQLVWTWSCSVWVRTERQRV